MNGLVEQSPLASYLDAGESLVWSGKAKQGLRLQSEDLFMIPFSMMWGGFAIFWEAGVLGLVHMGDQPHKAAPSFMAIWGIPFVAIGLYMMVGRFFYDAWSRGRTVYGVTDRRLIVFQKGWGSQIETADVSEMNNLKMVERGDGSGDIIFNSMLPVGRGTGRTKSPGFYLLPDVRRVYSLIRDVQQKARN